MDSVTIKKSDETIEKYIDKLNDITSLDVGAAIHHNPSLQIGWGTISFSTLMTFLRVYFGQMKFLNGVEGFLIAHLAAIHTLAAKVKLWEYRMREKEGNGFLLPINKEEIQILKNKYSS